MSNWYVKFELENVKQSKGEYLQNKRIGNQVVEEKGLIYDPQERNIKKWPNLLSY